MIINPGRGNLRMPQPLLHLDNICLVIKGARISPISTSAPRTHYSAKLRARPCRIYNPFLDRLHEFMGRELAILVSVHNFRPAVSIECFVQHIARMARFQRDRYPCC